MPFGTRYPLLHKLEKDGVVKGEFVSDKSTYKLTLAGKKMAHAEVGQVQQYAKALSLLVPS